MGKIPYQDKIRNKRLTEFDEGEEEEECRNQGKDRI